MSMSIKRAFIPLITLYSVTAVIMSKNLNFTNILTGGIILSISIFIHIKDNSIIKSVKLTVFIFYFIIFSIFFFYSRIIIFNIERDFAIENRKDVILTGYICDITKDEEGKFKFILKTDTGYNYFVTSKMNDFFIGDIIKISGKAYKPEPVSNKGQFDYQKYCYSKNISADIYVNDNDINKTGVVPIQKFIGNIRIKAVNRVMEKLNEDRRGIVTALITGSYAYIDKNTNEIYQNSGLSHILSISGTHFGILILPLYSLFTLISKNKKISIIITIIITIFLLVFTGLKISAVRSALCLITVFICKFFFLDSNRYLPICISILVIITINPLSVYDTGFIMSYACVISIALFKRNLDSIFLRLFKIIKKAFIDKLLEKYIILEDYYRRLQKTRLKLIFIKLLSSISLILSIQPLMMFITYKISQCIYPYSIYSNLMAFLLISPILLSLWIGILIPTVMCPIFEFLINILMKIALYTSSLPFSKLFIRHVPDLIFVIFLFAYAFIKLKPVKLKIQKIFIYIITTILGMIMILLSNIPKIVFMDVGQGDCALIKVSYGHSILIDTGEYIDSSCIAYYTGNKINTIILTHSDSDHCGAIKTILDDFEVDNLYLPYSMDKANISIINDIKYVYPDINIVMLSRGDVIKDKGLFIKILNPDLNNVYADVNESSIVLNLYTEAGSILFAADADLKKIPLDYFLKCNIIKMPHHGDADVINIESLEYISPHAAIISVGKYNPYGHPEQKTLDILMIKGIKTLRTDIDGSITTYIINKKYYMYKFK